MKVVRAAPRYGIDCYDRHVCLKAPFVSILVMLFACREFLLPLVVLLNSIKGRSYGIDFLLQDNHTYALLSEVPALLVAYAFVRRAPSGEAFARWIWKMGRVLLATAVVLDLCLVASELGQSLRRLHDEDFFALLRMAIDLGILAYLLLSHRVRDVFNDFPLPLSKPARST